MFLMINWFWYKIFSPGPTYFVEERYSKPDQKDVFESNISCNEVTGHPVNYSYGKWRTY
jgi:hypothetical protein